MHSTSQEPALGAAFWPWYGYFQEPYLLSSTGVHLFPSLQIHFLWGVDWRREISAPSLGLHITSHFSPELQDSTVREGGKRCASIFTDENQKADDFWSVTPL